jgi:hypothetical protein
MTAMDDYSARVTRRWTAYLRRCFRHGTPRMSKVEWLEIKLAEAWARLELAQRENATLRKDRDNG